ncbi:hypothetical protein RDI58_021578 [Solanum bulbocastanum]|uniref:Uncharacterized protein n=1 Tax=Solanum bulbocastanum TaxID=147425 RepID=A0AAN8Y4W4_SOLBU
MLSDRSSDSRAGAGGGTSVDNGAADANYEPIAPVSVIVSPHVPTPAPESLELSENMRTCYVSEIVFDTLTSLSFTCILIRK